MQSYVGESEHQLRRLFAEARRHAPSLILLDEVDALCPRQRSSHNDIEQRVALCMCSQLDAVVSCSSVMSAFQQILHFFEVYSLMPISVSLFASVSDTTETVAIK